MATRLKSGETILFIGDSITDCGRTGQERPLGIGYVKQFSDMLAIREPAKRIAVINKGIGGNGVVDLRNRWTDDVLRHRPDWLSVKIGINDLNRTLSGNPEAVPPKLFEKTYDEILSRTTENLPRCRILLIDPFYISVDRSPDSARARRLELLPAYLDVVHRMSRRYRTRLVRTHEMFQKLLRHHDPDIFCPEPVHPYPTGHFAIAEAVYAALSR
jgi:lysophospholipase L1-like esterase